jgi:hypothetical protein
MGFSSAATTTLRVLIDSGRAGRYRDERRFACVFHMLIMSS